MATDDPVARSYQDMVFQSMVASLGHISSSPGGPC